MNFNFMANILLALKTEKKSSMLLKDYSDFLLCFADTLEPGRRKPSDSNVIEAKRQQSTEKIKRTRSLWLHIQQELE